MTISNKIVLHFEGDSISANAAYTYAYYRQSKWSWVTFNYAVAGATIQGNSGNSLTGREQTVGAAFIPNATNVLSVYIGANNFGTTTTATNDADMAALVAYCDRMRQRGFYVVVWTMSPQSSATHSIFLTNRATYNPQYRAMLGVNCHAIIDIEADSIMGPDAAGNDTSLYGDGLHPTTLGHGHLARIATPIFDSFGRAATGGLPVGKGAFDFDTRRFRIVF